MGHRYLGGIEASNYVWFCCFKLLSEFQRKHPGLVAVSASSQGADTIFADVALSLEIKLDIITPFKEFASDFQTELGLKKMEVLHERSSNSVCANFSKRSVSAYKKSMELVVIRSHSLIGVWDSQSNGSPGGTAQAINVAKTMGLPIFHINPRERSLSIIGPLKSYGMKEKRIELNTVGSFV